MTAWLADTGPLVALLDGDDAHHPWAVAQVKTAPAKLFTCEAVLTEALFLLNRRGCRPDGLFGMVESGFLECDMDYQCECRSVHALMRRYRDQPMSFADACLVRLAEMRGAACVWTLDRDFRIYRLQRNHAIPLITPW